MRKCLIAVASLGLCFGIVACEDADDDVDMGVMSSATATDDSGCCPSKAAEANPGVVSSESNCSEKATSCNEKKAAECPFSSKN